MNFRSQTPLVGVIRSVGIGPEIIDAGLRCFTALSEIHSLNFHIESFDPTPQEINPDDATLKRLASFYEHIRSSGGVILRASCHATLVYRLRQQFDLLYKLVPLTPIPELADVSLVDLSR
ncbi:MAG TPA: hypothetical protein VGN88_01455, partial [Phycisphaerae bacterium]